MEKKKFYVTGWPGATKEQDDNPVAIYGSSGLDALCTCGLTVWTEDGWESAREAVADLKRIMQQQNQEGM